MSRSDERLDEAASRYWSDRLATRPVGATALGFRQCDTDLPPLDPGSLSEITTRWESRKAEVESIPEGELTEDRALTRKELIATLERELDALEAAPENYLVSQMNGPHVRLLRLAQLHPISKPSHAGSYLSRLEIAGPWIRQHAANLRAGAETGRVTSLKPLQRVAKQLTKQLETPTCDWSLAQHAASWDAASGDKAVELLDSGVRPAMADLLSLLLGELQPQARPNDKPGLCHLPGGEDDYTRCIHTQTSLRSDPQEVHDRGLAEVGRLHGVILPLAEKTLGVRDIASLRQALEGSAELRYRDEADVLDKARRAVERADVALKTITSLDPGSSCHVEAVPPVEAPDAPLGYYRAPATDGSRPGTYYVNTYAPTTKLAIDAEGVAFHEAVPGHHLQIAVAQRLDLPDFRRFVTLSAYAEGWALYSEKLADELGLYTGDTDRLGMLGQDLWRAARLVLDTGLHALGWSRQEAIDFAVRETLLPLEMIENEIDRFVVMPGQALGYKLGEFEILNLRRKWEMAETSFKLSDFHDAVLRSGGLSLGTLREVAAPPAEC